MLIREVQEEVEAGIYDSPGLAVMRGRGYVKALVQLLTHYGPRNLKRSDYAGDPVVQGRHI